MRVPYLVKIPAHTKMSEYLFRKTVLVYQLTTDEDVCIFFILQNCVTRPAVKLCSREYVHSFVCVLLHCLELVARTEDLKQA